MDTMIAQATTSYETTMGFSIHSTVQWMADHLLFPIVGSGLGVLDEMKWYIIGLIVLGLIIYFAFRGFRFSKV